ncbi:uncharacterized protein YpmB [Scopulibacillus daqui]|uniref:Uncharacterized protein YpmB n=1 Tax=Scopulibacillus daqui TaxID=1469162 RepID=A0ABS2Q148_9BACL|nr:hypothetical protein [Scopulibacillus daqui]MBM7646017.1 uncharacterized protein YpmB [Scopulibacillus daqui]
MKGKKKRWITIGIIILVFIIFIGGAYLKHKQGEREFVVQAEKAAEKYLKEEGIKNPEFKSYEISPMRILHLTYLIDGAKKRNRCRYG